MSATAQNLETLTVDYQAIKARQQNVWASGDYATIGTTLQLVGEQLCETADLSSGSRVLDVAAGNGNATLAAARRFCRVTSTDYVPELLEKSRQRANAEGLAVDFEFADVESLPYADNEYDAVISTYGVMFAPDQETAAQEMARVCKPGGIIATANWTPAGFVGQVFKIIGRYLPPPAGLQPPSRWGDEAGLRAIFGNTATVDRVIHRDFVFRYCSIDHFLDVFKSYYGPVHKAYAALGDQAGELDQDLRALLNQFNRATDGTLKLPSEYVEAICIVK